MDPNASLLGVPRYGSMDPLQQLIALLHGFAFQAGLSGSTASQTGSQSGGSAALGGGGSGGGGGGGGPSTIPMTPTTGLH